MHFSARWLVLGAAATGFSLHCNTEWQPCHKRHQAKAPTWFNPIFTDPIFTGSFPACWRCLKHKKPCAVHQQTGVDEWSGWVGASYGGVASPLPLLSPLRDRTLMTLNWGGGHHPPCLLPSDQSCGKIGNGKKSASKSLPLCASSLSLSAQSVFMCWIRSRQSTLEYHNQEILMWCTSQPAMLSSRSWRYNPFLTQY